MAAAIETAPARPTGVTAAPGETGRSGSAEAAFEQVLMAIIGAADAPGRSRTIPEGPALASLTAGQEASARRTVRNASGGAPERGAAAGPLLPLPATRTVPEVPSTLQPACGADPLPGGCPAAPAPTASGTAGPAAPAA
ncbi:MAG: hypothetical protein NZM27_03575, partial [Acetobacteraceae bacterium]|nr:hypothetical protein [Acetobacteraceae bacterium]